MKCNCGPKAVWLPLLLGAVVAVGLPLYVRLAPAPATPAPAEKAPAPAAAAPVPPPTPPPAPAPKSPRPEDPLLRSWQDAIKVRNAAGVMNAQSAFLSRENDYREPLMKMATEDGDPRIRAFSVAVLGRMKSPPAESFFLERLDDASEYPRISALEALEKIGSSACLQKVDSLAFSDFSNGVQAAAVKTAKAVRSR